MDSSIPHNVHYRKIVGDKDDHSNTASTYLLSDGYRQTLAETGITAASKLITTSDTTMKVHVTDTVTFPKNQIYNTKDELYVRIVGGLQKTLSNQVTAEQFPSGTSGTAKFYVYTKKGSEKQYYTYANGAWNTNASEAKKEAVQYEWSSTGGAMELPLSTNGQSDGLIDLHILRDEAKKTADEDATECQLFIEVELDAALPPTQEALSVIPESEAGDNEVPTDFTKLTYTAQLSVVSQSLNSSSNRALLSNTTTAYYRAEPAGAKLTYDADNIDQLGINLLDMRYLDASQEHSLIDTTAVYDLSTMKNVENALKNSSGIRFTLSLQQKDTETEKTESYKDLSDPQKYLDVVLKSENSGTVKQDGSQWSWTVPKSTYYNEQKNGVEKNDLFDGSALTQNILLKVDVAQVETLKHLYANYNVVLTAEILGTDGSTGDNTKRTQDNIVYTLTKIKTEFVE